MMVTAAGLVVVAGLVGVLVDAQPLVVSALLVLVGAAVVLLIDLRRRAGESSGYMRRAAQRDRALSQQVAELSRAVASIKSAAGLEHRVVAAMRPLEERAVALEGRVVALDARIAQLDESVGEPVQRALGPDGQMEQMERRILGSFEAERLRAADRHRELQTGVEAAGSEITSAKKILANGQKRAVTELTAVARDETRQVEALLQIVPGLEGRRALLPPSGRWAMDARSIAHLLDLVRTHRPTRVVELGSGTSSVWLGYTLRELSGTLVSVDHDEHFAGLTRESLVRHGLEDVAQVRLAPLTGTDGETWYDREAITDLTGVDLLIVDGPPGSSGPRVRAAALPFFAERLAPGALVVLDDSDRPDEAAIADEWAAQFGLERIETGVSRLAVLRSPLG